MSGHLPNPELLTDTSRWYAFYVYSVTHGGRTTRETLCGRCAQSFVDARNAGELSDLRLSRVSGDDAACDACLRTDPS